MPPAFERLNDLMHIRRLDAGGDLGLLCVGFRLTDRGGDPWTARFDAFKRREAAAVANGARTLAAAFVNVGWEGRRVVVVGAISSRDVVLGRDAPVRRLGEALSAAKQWEWRPDLLTKQPHASLHGIYDAGRRDATVNGVYASVAIGGVPGVFLVVDDFTTRGSTIGDVARALRAANAGWGVYGAALAKTERASYWVERGGIDNNHVPERLLVAWDGA